jgi:hypothetical protein
MPDDPLFILGTERSGSNLVRLILNAHSRIHIPHPPHVIRYFAPIEKRYGKLSDTRNLDRLASDVLRLVRAHIHPWDAVPSVEELVWKAHPSDLFGLYYALYDFSREHGGKARWGCKSTFMIDHVDRVRQTWPDARFILLVRDPRDVAVSSRGSVFSTFHPYHTARLWASQQTTGSELLRVLPAAAITLIRYEDLLADPEGEVRKIAAFLEESFEPAMLRFFDTPEARKVQSLSESWHNTASPIVTGNTGRFRTGLSSSELRMVEDVVGPLMERFGYPRALPASVSGSPRLSPIRRLGVALGDTRERVGVEWASFRKDRNFRLRWRRALVMTWIRLGSRTRSFTLGSG